MFATLYSPEDDLSVKSMLAQTLADKSKIVLLKILPTLFYFINIILGFYNGIQRYLIWREPTQQWEVHYQLSWLFFTGVDWTKQSPGISPNYRLQMAAAVVFTAAVRSKYTANTRCWKKSQKNKSMGEGWF